jgi:hypothetical protein
LCPTSEGKFYFILRFFFQEGNEKGRKQKEKEK